MGGGDQDGNDHCARLDESITRNLAAQAKEHGRSVEAEARDILARVSDP
ncbi:FitA-like ribbon-helix-helix domain-containing protein [Nesterenkonia muleiensis]